MAVYDTIKRICDQRRISIHKLEMTAGVGNGTIGGWKKRMPRMDSLIAVAKALDIPVELLIRK